MKRFFEPVFEEKIKSLKSVFASIILSLIWIWTIIFLKEITNSIQDWLNFNLLYSFIFLILLNYFVLIFTKNWIDATLWPLFRKNLYKKYIKKIIWINNNDFEQIWTWKLIWMVDKWVRSFSQMLVTILWDVVYFIVFIIWSFIFISFINKYYWIITFSIFIFILILTVFLQKKANIFREKRRDLEIWISKKFVNILMSKFEVLQNWKIDKEIDFIWDSLDINIYYNSKIMTYHVVTKILIKWLIDWWKIIIILMFWIWLFNNQINFWEFVALMSVVYVLDQVFKKFIQIYIDFTKIFVDVEKLWDFFDNSTEIKWYLTWKNFEYKKWEIELKNISYWYWEEKDDNLVFKNFNLKIAWWKVTAFVWNSWSWKSTLIKLISWYISATWWNNSWEIFIDGQKISELSLKNYYKNIWYLTQDPSVFDGTILDNLTYAVDRKLKNWELESILKQAKCEFIYDLKNWINTEIGERWVRLSWWQKQRLAIAKIFLKDPKIIFLDEPTSALDSFSEDQITKAMHNLFKWRTVVIVAHRLQTVKNADEIILIENWEIFERWKHDKLVEKWGQYARMLELQSGF